MLRDMVAQGCGACVMEVSSHALALKRVDYLRFAAGVFTNLTRDHLDFHRNMDDYFAAKRRLFELLPEQAVAVVNLDDRRGAELTRHRVTRTVTYAIDAAADVTPGRSASSLDGLHVRRRDAARARSTSSRGWSAGPTPTTSWRRLPPRLALDLPLAAIEARHRRPARRAGQVSARLRAAATTFASSSTTRTPTTR